MTPSKKLFQITSIIITLIIFGVAFLYFLNIFSIGQINSITIAFVISSFNAFMGMVFVKSGLNKTDKIFFRRAIGGMVLRLFMTLLLVVLVLVFLELNRISFIFSILFFYIFYLVIEIIFLNFRQI